jgi:hypothetical protein
MPQSTNEQRENHRERFASIRKIARHLGVLLAVITGVVSIVKPLHAVVHEIKQAREDANNEKKVLKVTSLAGIVPVLDRDVAIKAQIQKFLSDYPDAEKVVSKVKEFGTGRDAYFSKDFADLAAVGHHYETLGALAKKDYIDIDLIYTIVEFPRDFWDRTAGFRDMVRRNNWYGTGHPLPDFWENFEWLHSQYDGKVLPPIHTNHRRAAGRW